ncbi:uncharacterized protein BYT42DRAFT_547235 [Radiomyces spectabilis]|uniref:uncharacterized protein n=1 Tax=Radiomyces spectabilis TaxID=64574 RepID=UPI00222110FE|nr:uncharacterized protein BYT42DRAFT_547235 [Radiomyces spectabilis]KAI8374143.1 hypothetical protein BYT42DRAFT_547235 [Radiomyces spectabilis]
MGCCTDLNPSPTGNDLSNPGLDWTRQTLYTTGQPCPACSAHIVYRNVGRVVWGSSMEYMITTGRQAQLTLDIEDMVNSAVMVGSDTPKKLPILEGGVLKDECDHVFWCAFKEFRDTAYYEAMKAAGKEDYVIMQDQRFPCATIPFRRQQ